MIREEPMKLKIEKSMKQTAGSLTMSIKIDKPLARPTKLRGKTQIISIRNEIEDITTDPADIKRIRGT